MSAIWGQIPYNNSQPNKTNEMKQHYENTCRIDCYQESESPSFYMACGIQHITPEAKLEVLPIQDESICFTADCVLDNRAELLTDLGIASPNVPDGTLMYHAYCKWGMDCIHHFRGAFSFAVYHIQEQCLYLAVDPVASRCLYYHKNKTGITFSTLLQPILEANPDISLNELYLKDFLVAPGMMPTLTATETPYEQIFLVSCGTYVKFTPTTCEEIRYWDIYKEIPEYHRHNAREYSKLFYELYSAAVQDTLRANGNVGIAMSSGLDSASVGVLAAQELATRGESLYSYTYVPCEACATDKNKNNVHNETSDVLEIAKMHPNIMTHFLNNEGKNSYEEIEHVLKILEIPVKAFVNFPNLLEVYRTGRSDGCRIMLSGQTGNASVSHGYIDDVLFELFRTKKYLTFLLYLNRYSKNVKESRKQALKGCLRYFRYAENQLNQPSFHYTISNPFISEKILEDYPLQERFLKGNLSLTTKIPTCKFIYDKMLYNPNALTYIGSFETKIGLTYNLLLRDPTKDVRILRFCYNLPYHYFAYKGEPRWLLRNGFKKLLPAQLTNNWLRYGVQNSDWYNRINRDWLQVQSLIKNDLSHPFLLPYTKHEEIHLFFDQKENRSEKQNDTLLHQLIFLCVLSKYFNYTKK